MWRLRSILTTVCLALTVSCLSPNLPLPPPDLPSATQTSATTYHLVGHGVEANVDVIIKNTNTTLPNNQRLSGTVADANGNWDAYVYASSGDTLHIWQQYVSYISPYTTYTIP